MKRRKFIKKTSTTAALLPLAGSVELLISDPEKEGFLKLWITENDKRIANILALQQTDAGHRFYGGFPDKFDIYHPSRPAAYAQHLISAFVSKESKYYHSKEIEQCLKLGMDFLLKTQHADGTIDLLTTNFHSPPDTAFAVEPLSLALSILKKFEANLLGSFQKQAEDFLKKAGAAMSVGGIHTPNHRWVVCRALSRIHVLFPDQKYLDRIEQWLGEGIDIDPDGQYTEKSSVAYSPLCNNCFITIARLLNKPDLYGVVRKNLQMTQYLVHANGEVVTEASTRQDQFTIANMSRYYYAYRYMALLDKQGTYSAMARQIEKSVGMEGLSGNLPYFLEDDSLHKNLPAKKKLSTHYTKLFPYSKMARLRWGNTDATILGENNSFFTFFNGMAALQAVRFASAFFGKGQFSSQKLEQKEGEYILTQTLIGPYYQPHETENIAEDGDWHKMPRKLRQQSEVQTLKSEVRITEHKGKFNLHFSIEGTDHIPLAIELAFRKGGSLSGVEKVPEIDAAYFLKEGFGIYTFGKDRIRFGPGKQEHSWTQLRGAKAKLNGDSVYLTGYTPFEFDLEVG